jgi:hypothetical protein
VPFSLVVIRGGGWFQLTAREPTIYFVFSLLPAAGWLTGNGLKSVMRVPF